ncbi:cytochrome b5 [Amanita muscaria]
MASYLTSWLWSGTTATTVPQASTSTPSLQISPPPTADDDANDDGSDTETEHADDDRPPAFPSLQSAQRMKTSRVPRVLKTDAELMPPPPLPNLANRTPGVARSQLGSTLAVPPTTTKPPNQNKKREKVALAPGHSPLDWARVKSSGQDLRGVDTLLKIPPSLLKQHNKRDDAWTAINGKVYNITPYLPFHPGGEKELMRVAGRDGSKLFAYTHAWVNADFMLDACFVGFLVPEPAQ